MIDQNELQERSKRFAAGYTSDDAAGVMRKLAGIFAFPRHLAAMVHENERRNSELRALGLSDKAIEVLRRRLNPDGMIAVRQALVSGGSIPEERRRLQDLLPGFPAWVVDRSIVDDIETWVNDNAHC